MMSLHKRFTDILDYMWGQRKIQVYILLHISKSQIDRYIDMYIDKVEKSNELKYSSNIFHKAKVYIYICMKRFSEKKDKRNEK